MWIQSQESNLRRRESWCETDRQYRYFGKDLDRPEPCCVAGGNVNWYNFFENCLALSTPVESHSTVTQQFHIPPLIPHGRYILNECVRMFTRRRVRKFLSTPFIKAPNWRLPKGLLREQETCCSVFTQWNPLRQWDWMIHSYPGLLECISQT